MVLYHHTQYIGTTTTEQLQYSSYTAHTVVGAFVVGSVCTRNHLPPEENVQYKLIFRITIKSQLIQFYAIKPSPFTHPTWYVGAPVYLELRNVRTSETALG